MPYTTNVAGTTITASWGNANVRDQVVTPFTDSTARSSAISVPVAGMLSSLTTTGRLDIYNGSSWSAVVSPVFGSATSWTPTLTGSVTNPTLGTGSAQNGGYWRMGRLIVAYGRVLFGTSGAAAGSGNLQLSVPVNIAGGASSAFIYGTVHIKRAGTYSMEPLAPASATQMNVLTAGAGTVTAATGFTNNDLLGFFMIYEAATDA